MKNPSEGTLTPPNGMETFSQFWWVFPAAMVFATIVIATSGFILAITADFGVAIHTLSADPAWHVVAWSIPGVLIAAR